MRKKVSFLSSVLSLIWKSQRVLMIRISTFNIIFLEHYLFHSSYKGLGQQCFTGMNFFQENHSWLTSKFWLAKIFKKFVMITDLGVQTRISPGVPVWIFPSRAQYTDFFSSRGPFNRKIKNLDPYLAILVVQKEWKNDKIFPILSMTELNFEIYRSPEPLVWLLPSRYQEMFIPYVEGSSNWNSLIFAHATDFSWYAENAEKCTCYCYLFVFELILEGSQLEIFKQFLNQQRSI